MKKTIIVMLALFLALPAISFAGSATSRWDMTIGGYVKFDMGYNTQGQGNDIVLAARQGVGPYANVTDKYGSFFMYSGETRLNFLVRGPDAWGAKTSAFVEGHFRGNEYSSGGAAPASYNSFGLRHAFMQFDWPTSKLVIGQTWQTWGILPTFANTLLDYNNLGPFLKGMRQPLVRFEQTLAKNWTWKLGIISPTNTLGSNTSGNSQSAYGNVDSYTRSQMPYFEGSFGFSSDKCGKIGPWQMLFALEGFYGRQKQISATSATAYAANMYSVNFTDKDVDSWGISFKGFVPIIPEKKGDKKGAFSASGMAFYTQNPGMFQSPGNSGGGLFNENYSYSGGSYAYGATGNGNILTLTAAQMAALDYSAPVQWGFWGQLSYFITDKLFVNGWYGYTATQASNAWRLVTTGTTDAASSIGGNSNNQNAFTNTTQIIGNIMYDVNAAIRFGFEYTWYKTTYSSYVFAPVTDYTTNPNTTSNQLVGAKDGTAQSFRVGAYYFF